MTADDVIIITMLATIAGIIAAIAAYYYDTKIEQERKK